MCIQSLQILSLCLNSFSFPRTLEMFPWSSLFNGDRVRSESHPWIRCARGPTCKSHWLYSGFQIQLLARAPRIEGRDSGPRRSPFRSWTRGTSDCECFAEGKTLIKPGDKISGKNLMHPRLVQFRNIEVGLKYDSKGFHQGGGLNR